MGVFSHIGASRPKYENMGAIPKGDSAYQLLQAPQYENMGDINWTSNELYGILLSGAVLGVMAVILFNRKYL
tara:strand:- start:243 stop:458 length:216 start_codon:yes stop_codon:yes gene_type:complete